MGVLGIRCRESHDQTTQILDADTDDSRACTTFERALNTGSIFPVYQRSLP